MRFTTAARDLSWNSQTWTAVGGNIGIDAMGESADDAAAGLAVQLSGVDQTILASIVAEQYRGRLARVWYAHWNQSTGAVVANPYLMFSGFMNEDWEIDDVRPVNGVGTVTIRTRFTSRLALLQQTHGVLCNVDSHRSNIAAAASVGTEGDTFFLPVPNLATRKIYWGSASPASLDPVRSQQWAGRG